MEKTKAFFKKYWSTILIYAALILFYWAMTSSGKLNAYLFPKIGAIGRAFYDNRDNMLVNLVSSIGMMIPSIIISIVVALSIGTLLGLHAKIRDALHPVICLQRDTLHTSFPLCSAVGTHLQGGVHIPHSIRLLLVYPLCHHNRHNDHRQAVS